jgi:small subunit ribosomal protein S4
MYNKPKYNKSQPFLVPAAAAKKILHNRLTISEEQAERALRQARSIKVSISTRYFQERRKLSALYGNLSQKHIKKLVGIALKEKGAGMPVPQQLISLLERRLDVVLYRTLLSPTIIAARQVINHEQVTVNGMIVDRPGYLLQPGDVLSITPSAFKQIEFFLTTKTDRLTEKKTRSVDLLNKLEKPFFFYRKNTNRGPQPTTRPTKSIKAQIYKSHRPKKVARVNAKEQVAQ